MFLKSKKWKLKTETAQRKLKLNIQIESGVFLRKKFWEKKESSDKRIKISNLIVY